MAADGTATGGRGKKRTRRTWGQRGALTLASLTSLSSFATASGLWYANHQLGQLKRFTVTHVPITAAPAPTTTVLQIVDSVGATTSTGPTTTEPSLPPVDPKAVNFLLYGTDSRACIDPNSPYAPAFLGPEDTGTNLDTIMVIRVDPVTSTAAILSFPRDLWVRMPNGYRSNKINSVDTKSQPDRLGQTIELNFGFKVDHTIRVDFCAVKSLVDAVGGINVPFLFAARDGHTGLDVDKGCHHFGGEEALAYVRSRYYQWFNGKEWIDDGSEFSDLSRIARQQDFVKRMVQKAVEKGARKPTVAKKLIEIALKNVQVDNAVNFNDLLALSQVLKGLDPVSIKSYRFEGYFSSIGGDSIQPDFQSDVNKKILAVYRGQARLASATTSGGFDPTTGTAKSNAPSTSTTTSTTTTVKTNSSTSPGSTTSSSTTSTTAVVSVKENAVGAVPPNDPSCR
jgi:LCP family protein required for cell wall assembly